MNCPCCGYLLYERDHGEMWCPCCEILKKLKDLKERITEIEITIVGYDFPKTHSELTRGAFEGVTNLAEEIALIKHNLQKLMKVDKNDPARQHH